MLELSADRNLPLFDALDRRSTFEFPADVAKIWTIGVKGFGLVRAFRVAA